MSEACRPIKAGNPDRPKCLVMPVGCPRCKHPYHGLHRGGWPEDLVYECFGCGHVEMITCPSEAVVLQVLRLRQLTRESS
jgi:hypothetical protein